MEPFEQLLLNVWREACRHLELSASIKTITRMLSRPMSVDQCVLCRVDEHSRRIETLAVGIPKDGQWRQESGSQWSAAEIQRLVRWCRRGQLTRCTTKAHDRNPAAAVIPDWLSGDVLVGPLVSEHGTIGLLMLRRQGGGSFQPSDERIGQALLEPLTVALENHRWLQELSALREAAEADKRSALSRLGRDALTTSIIGEHGGLKPVMERTALVARTNIPVLLLGETGTGKEVIARAIHDRSPRHDGPFIRVNCGAIPPDLIDSELFGHERGAFTGAAATHHGWFERADRGTLLLDEVGELPPAAQVRLLRVLQENAFERVGGERPIGVDVRIVAATHRNLVAAVHNSDFREDLWYRIAGMPIILPPLRERQEDIPALVEHFAARAARHFGLMPQQPSADELHLLTTYDWPGNVRELGAVIDRAAILGDGRRLEVAKALGIMPATTTTPHTAALQRQPAVTASPPADMMSLDTAMRRHIESALVVSHGRVEGPHGAADLLRINPHTLRARMRKLGIDWQRFRTAG